MLSAQNWLPRAGSRGRSLPVGHRLPARRAWQALAFSASESGSPSRRSPSRGWHFKLCVTARPLTPWLTRKASKLPSPARGRAVQGNSHRMFRLLMPAFAVFPWSQRTAASSLQVTPQVIFGSTREEMILVTNATSRYHILRRSSRRYSGTRRFVVCFSSWYARVFPLAQPPCARWEARATRMAATRRLAQWTSIADLTGKIIQELPAVPEERYAVGAALGQHTSSSCWPSRAITISRTASNTGCCCHDDMPTCRVLVSSHQLTCKITKLPAICSNSRVGWGHPRQFCISSRRLLGLRSGSGLPLWTTWTWAHMH